MVDILNKPYSVHYSFPAVVEASAETASVASSIGVSSDSPAIKDERAGEIVTESSQQTDIESLIRAEFGADSERAIKIAYCESRLDPSRVGDKHMEYWSYGVFQINRTWHRYPVEVLLDPVQNIKIAHEIFLKGGWGRWTCDRLI